jgi:hypothetical protein
MLSISSSDERKELVPASVIVKLLTALALLSRRGSYVGGEAILEIGTPAYG